MDSKLSCTEFCEVFVMLAGRPTKQAVVFELWPRLHASGRAQRGLPYSGGNECEYSLQSS